MHVAACVGTFALDPLPEDAVHESATHLTEGGPHKGVWSEAVRNVDLEALLQELQDRAH